MADPQTLADTFLDHSAGMDSSRSPEVLGQTSYALGVNIVARDGMPQTRPKFQRVELKVPDAYRTGFFQGAEDYYNPTTGGKLIVAVVSGRVYVIDPLAQTITDLSAVGSLVNDGTAEHYLCQAESFLVINNGKDVPLIFDGTTLRRATSSEVPIGKIMAYGQGRLFVTSPDFRSILACDLVYGGSNSQVGILTSAPGSGATANATLVNTRTQHGFTTGDVLTISGHSSTPTINGTWQITVASPTSFAIPTPLTSGGGGGVAVKPLAGKESDVLRNTESGFLNEKGIFRLPAWMGKITFMCFFPIQDTGTGQGDMLVGGEHGACSFAVSQPRETWENIAIQKVALTEIGFVGWKSGAQVNGDIYFGSWDGIRSYRNARAEFSGFGHTPLSAEMARIITPMAREPLPSSSMAYFDSRLYYTTSPRMLPPTDLTTPPRVIFKSLTVLDFQQSARISRSTQAAYDGVWTGLDVVQLLPCKFGPDERFYCFAWQSTNGMDGTRNNELWEITKEHTGYDLWRDCAGGRHEEPISAAIETRAFNFNSIENLKRLLRADLWLSGIRGTASVRCYWRPDIHPDGWFHWASFVKSRTECAGNQPGAGVCNVPLVKPGMFAPQVRLTTPPDYDDAATNRPANRGYTFQLRLEWDGLLQLVKGAVMAGTMTEPAQGDASIDFTQEEGSFPLLKQPLGYYIVPAPECAEGQGDCVPFANVLVAPPDSLEFLLINNGGAPVSWAAGSRVLQSLGNGTWFTNVANAGYTGSIQVAVDPDRQQFDVTLTPNVGQPTTTFTAKTAVETCFTEPVTTHTQDFAS